MKVKHILEKLDKKEQERYHFAYLTENGAVVPISSFVKDDESGMLIFYEDNKKISVKDTIHFLNKISKRKVCLSREFINGIKTIISIILSEMEEKKISYDEIYDRLHGIEKALELKDQK